MFEHDLHLHLILLLLETVVHPNLRFIQVYSEAHKLEANLGWKSKLNYWLQFCRSDIRLQNFFYQGVLSSPGKVGERMLEELIKSPLPVPSTTPPSSSLPWFHYQFVAGGQWTMRGAKVQNIIFSDDNSKSKSKKRTKESDIKIPCTSTNLWLLDRGSFFLKKLSRYSTE